MVTNLGFRCFILFSKWFFSHHDGLWVYKQKNAFFIRIRPFQTQTVV